MYLMMYYRLELTAYHLASAVSGERGMLSLVHTLRTVYSAPESPTTACSSQYKGKLTATLRAGYDDAAWVQFASWGCHP